MNLVIYCQLDHATRWSIFLKLEACTSWEDSSIFTGTSSSQEVPHTQSDSSLQMLSATQGWFSILTAMEEQEILSRSRSPITNTGMLICIRVRVRHDGWQGMLPTVMADWMKSLQSLFICKLTIHFRIYLCIPIILINYSQYQMWWIQIFGSLIRKS